MPRIRDGTIAISALVGFSFWLFVVLPIYYGPRHDQAADSCATEEYKNHGFWEKTQCDPVAYFTAWLVGFTAVLGLSTIGLWIAGERQLAHLKEASERQSKDIKSTIATAQEANRLNRDAFITTQRPWIAADVEPLGIEYDVNGLNVNARFILTNSGNSPAIHVNIHPRVVAPYVGAAEEEALEKFDPAGCYQFDHFGKKENSAQPVGFDRSSRTNSL